ncbi:hypothetical protein [Desulfovibrio sp. X2]|uniref:hypothetical protein n=1 Tax=Desulfovibrio sp. X2 TaxID=941449 RepID=UPI001268A0E7|nr:hypothetical protein [Desulfovibrio sp. X2]
MKTGDVSVTELMRDILNDSALLSELIPIYGGFFSNSLERVARAIEKRRLRFFLEEIKRCDCTIPKDIVESEEFVHAFLCTSEYVNRTLRLEKITILANVFKEYCKSINRNNISDNTDKLEYILSLVNDLGVVEIKLLNLLEEFEENAIRINSSFKKTEPDNEYHLQMRHEMAILLGVTQDKVIPYLVRLCRTGLCAEISGSF